MIRKAVALTGEEARKASEALNNGIAEQVQRERFQIENNDQLRWALQKMEENRKEIRAKKDMIQQASDYYQEQIDGLRKKNSGLEQLVMQYAELQSDENPNWKFKDSPYGHITRTKQKQELKVADKQALINRFKGTKFVEHVEEDKLKWGDLKSTLSSPDGEHVVNGDGELISDVTVVTKPSELQLKHKSAKGGWTTKED